MVRTLKLKVIMSKNELSVRIIPIIYNSVFSNSSKYGEIKVESLVNRYLVLPILHEWLINDYHLLIFIISFHFIYPYASKM